MDLTPDTLAFSAGFPRLLLHSCIGLLMLLAAVGLHILITPFRDLMEIRAGNAPIAAVLGATALGLALPLAAVTRSAASLSDLAVWGGAAMAVQLLATRIVDVLMARQRLRIEEGDWASAILLITAKLATSIVLAAGLAA
jgi:putative membrane protein